MNGLLKSKSAQDAPLNAKDESIEPENTLFISPAVKSPTAHCFPIDDEGRLLVGAYPRDREEFMRLVEHGRVRCFVNLTSDRRYETWFSASELPDGLEMLHRPMPRRNAVSSDSRVISIGREIITWLRDKPTSHCIYVHSELGYGRAGVIAAVLLGDLRNLQATDSIKTLEALRAALRADYEQEKIVPIVETCEQVQQVFRLLGNPQIDANGNQAVEEDSLYADTRTSTSAHSNDAGLGKACGARFVELSGGSIVYGTGNVENDTGVESSTASRGGAKYNDDDDDGEVPFGQDLEYILLPERSDTCSWIKIADGWIKERKKSRKALSIQVAETGGVASAQTPSKKRRV